jgi:glycosyltransferase involved in cell wall biosynthesis
VTEFRHCAVVPTYENPLTVAKVVAALRAHDLDVILVDDGSQGPGKEAAAACGDQET